MPQSAPAASNVITITSAVLAAPKLTVKDAAKLAGVDQSSVWRWTQSGIKGERKLKFVLIAGKRFIFESDLIQFLNELAAVGRFTTRAKPARRRRAA